MSDRNEYEIRLSYNGYYERFYDDGGTYKYLKKAIVSILEEDGEQFISIDKVLKNQISHK